MSLYVCAHGCPSVVVWAVFVAKAKPRNVKPPLRSFHQGESSMHVCTDNDIWRWQHLISIVLLNCVSKNVPLCDHPYLRQILTDFQNFFTGKLCGQVAVVWLLNISPHRNCIATLPCETLVVKNHKNFCYTYAKTIFWDSFPLIFILKENS